MVLVTHAGLTKKDIPYSAQVIRICDEYDALVTKRHYTTHVNISETLKQLIKDAQPTLPLVALDQLKQNERVGKINPKPLKALFKAVIDDVLYEISCIMNYVYYLKDQIKRLNAVERYDNKRINAKTQDLNEYYLAGMESLLQVGETIDNYKKIRQEYIDALEMRKKHIDDLYNEIKIIKKLRV